MNISRSKTANIINRLINLGYIEKENRTRGRGGKGSNLYTVCQEYYEDEKQSAEKTTDSISKGHRDSLPEEPDSMQDGLYKYSNKNIKDFIKKENLRDNMSTLELVLNMLAEATTTELSKTTNPQNFEGNINVAKKGGSIAGDADDEK